MNYSIISRVDSAVRFLAPRTALDAITYRDNNYYKDRPIEQILIDAANKLSLMLDHEVKVVELSSSDILEQDDVIFCLASDVDIISRGSPRLHSLVDELKESSGESYVYHCIEEGPAWIVANISGGLRSGVYRYLHSLGARWLAPHQAWEHLPKITNAHLKMSKLNIPAFDYFGYDGNGGLGPPGATPQADAMTIKSQWRIWDINNSAPLEWVGAASHYGEHFNFARQCHLRNDRSCLSWNKKFNGRGFDLYGNPFPSECFPPSKMVLSKLHHTYHGDGTGTYDIPPSPPWANAPKWFIYDCFPPTIPSCSLGLSPQDPATDTEDDPYPDVYSGYGGIVKIFSETVKNELLWNIVKYGPNHIMNKYPRVEPSDGSGACDCQKCKDLLRKGPYSNHLSPEQKQQDSNVSDRIFHLSNEVAKSFRHWFAEADFIPRPSLMAYADHWVPPSIPVEPGTLVQVVPLAGDGTNYTQKEFLELWSNKLETNPLGKFKLSFTKQWLLSGYVFDLPQLSPRTMISEFMEGVDLKYSGLNMQTTYGHGPMGITLWMIFQLIWEPILDIEDLIDEWFELSFDHIKEPIRRMYERWWDWYELTPHEVAVTFNDILDAQNLLDQSPDEIIQSRLDHIKLYALYLEKRLIYVKMFNEHFANPSAQMLALLDEVTEDYLQIIWSAFSSNVIHSYRIGFKAVLHSPKGSIIPERWKPFPKGEAWDTVKSLTTEELQSMILSRAKEVQPIPGVVRRKFKGSLVPLFDDVKETDYVVGVQSTTEGQFQVYKRTDTEDVTLDLITFGLKLNNDDNQDIRLIIRDQNENLISDTKHGFQTHKWISHLVTLSGPAGLYDVDVQTRDTSQQWKISAPRNVPLVNSRNFKGHTNKWSKDQKIYFYVPKGTRKIALSYLTKQDIQFYDPNDQPIITTKDDNMYLADVPKDMDAMVWSFTGLYSPNNWNRPRFETCPNVVSYSREQMLVPSHEKKKKTT